MEYIYHPQGVCSQEMVFDIEDGIVKDLKVIGGCHGNLQGISRLVKGLTVFTKCNIYILLPLISVLFIIYLLFKKKMSDINKKIMQYIIILYTISFGIVMCYVALLCLIDRYMIPAFIPMYLGDILLLVLIIKNITTKLEKKYNKSK